MAWIGLRPTSYPTIPNAECVSALRASHGGSASGRRSACYPFIAGDGLTVQASTAAGHDQTTRSTNTLVVPAHRQSQPVSLYPRATTARCRTRLAPTTTGGASLPVAPLADEG